MAIGSAETHATKFGASSCAQFLNSDSPPWHRSSTSNAKVCLRVYDKDRRTPGRCLRWCLGADKQAKSNLLYDAVFTLRRAYIRRPRMCCLGASAAPPRAPFSNKAKVRPLNSAIFAFFTPTHVCRDGTKDNKVWLSRKIGEGGLG